LKTLPQGRNGMLCKPRMSASPYWSSLTRFL
jgi:hypothetical protein